MKPAIATIVSLALLVVASSEAAAKKDKYDKYEHERTISGTALITGIVAPEECPRCAGDAPVACFVGDLTGDLDGRFRSALLELPFFVYGEPVEKAVLEACSEVELNKKLKPLKLRSFTTSDEILVREDFGDPSDPTPPALPFRALGEFNVLTEPESCLGFIALLGDVLAGPVPYAGKFVCEDE